MSCDKWKIFYLHYYNNCGRKAFQCGDILQEASTHKIAWPLDGVVIWGHLTPN